jgi:hypothetical protein
MYNTEAIKQTILLFETEKVENQYSSPLDIQQILFHFSKIRHKMQHIPITNTHNQILALPIYTCPAVSDWSQNQEPKK